MISLHFATDRPGTWQHSQTQAADLFLNIMLRVMSIQVAMAYHVCFIFCEIKMSYWFIYFSQSVPGRVAVVQEVTEEKGTWDSPSILHLHSTLSAYIWPTARHSVSVLALRAKKKLLQSQEMSCETETVHHCTQTLTFNFQQTQLTSI